MPEEPGIWFEAFCRREYVAVYRYVYAHTGNVEDAREAVQETFLSFYQVWQAGEVREHERALLFRIARNKAVDVVRRRQRWQAHEDEPHGANVLRFQTSSSFTPEEMLLEKERRQLAEKALAHLSERDQECLALRRSGLSNQQVADALNVNAVTVRQIVSRALRRFEQTYEQLLGQGKQREGNGKTAHERSR